MRIISPFKDYYDCIQSYGQDDLVYIRKTEEKVIAGRGVSGFRIIGFCGKLYPCYVDGYLKEERKYLFSIEEVDKLVNTTFSKNQQDNYYGKNKRRYRWNYDSREYIQAILNCEVRPGQSFDINQFKAIFDTYNIPIFVIKYKEYSKATLVTNIRLNQYTFQKVVPPYQAFQELSMWMSNQVKPFKPIPEVNDKDLAAAKGFDKFSFRKTKQI